MGSPVEVKISGLEEIQRRLLDELPKKAASGMRAALRDGAKIIQTAIVDDAPKDSGFLSEHVDIRTRVRGGGLNGSAFIGPNAKALYPASEGGLGQKKAHAHPASLVARWLEFGTSKMAANPFVSRAFERVKSAATDAVISRLKETFGL